MSRTLSQMLLIHMLSVNVIKMSMFSLAFTNPPCDAGHECLPRYLGQVGTSYHELH